MARTRTVVVGISGAMLGERAERVGGMRGSVVGRRSVAVAVRARVPWGRLAGLVGTRRGLLVRPLAWWLGLGGLGRPSLGVVPRGVVEVDDLLLRDRVRHGSCPGYGRSCGGGPRARPWAAPPGGGRRELA